jgi:hypothetical protein
MRYLAGLALVAIVAVVATARDALTALRYSKGRPDSVSVDDILSHRARRGEWVSARGVVWHHGASTMTEHYGQTRYMREHASQYDISLLVSPDDPAAAAWRRVETLLTQLKTIDTARDLRAMLTAAARHDSLAARIDDCLARTRPEQFVGVKTHVRTTWAGASPSFALPSPKLNADSTLHRGKWARGKPSAEQLAGAAGSRGSPTHRDAQALALFNQRLRESQARYDSLVRSTGREAVIAGMLTGVPSEIHSGLALSLGHAPPLLIAVGNSPWAGALYISGVSMFGLLACILLAVPMLITRGPRA